MPPTQQLTFTAQALHCVAPITNDPTLEGQFACEVTPPPIQVPPVQQIPRIHEEQVAPRIKLFVSDCPLNPNPKQVEPVQYAPVAHIPHVDPAMNNSQEDDRPAICSMQVPPVQQEPVTHNAVVPSGKNIPPNALHPEIFVIDELPPVQHAP